MLAQLAARFPELPSTSAEVRLAVLAALVDTPPPRDIAFWEMMLGQDSQAYAGMALSGVLATNPEHAVAMLPRFPDNERLGQAAALKLDLAWDSLPPRERFQFVQDIQAIIPRCGRQFGGPVQAWADSKKQIRTVAATGQPLANSDSELISHLLEQLGLALQHIRPPGRSASSHEMMADILRELSSACVVVNRDLAILYANKMARKHFGSSEEQKRELQFGDLPQVLGAQISEVLKSGAAVSNFRFKPGEESGAVFNATIVPFQGQQSGLPAAALLMAEEMTQNEQLGRLEIEIAKLRLVKTMADRLTHEIGNALVPLSVHQQMLSERLGAKSVDLDFLRTMERDLSEGVRRVARLTNQMRFLARDSLMSQEAFPLGPLLEEAFQDARRNQPAKSSQLKYDTGNKPIILVGDRLALKHAMAEVMLNALQANPADPRIDIHLRAEGVGEGNAGQLGVQIEVEDNGPGFTADAAEKASAPFFTTRNIGLGLGLAVSRKIIETHRGKLEIVPPRSHPSGLVRISLPVETTRVRTH